MTILLCLLFWYVGSSFSSRPLFLVLSVIATLAGYTWAVHRRLPFFGSKTPRRRWLISFGLASPIYVSFLLGWLFLMQSSLSNWDELARATFDSPADPKNKILFYDGGFLDRGLSLYVKPAGQRPRFVANVWWPPDAYFSSAEWTKDGEAFVCSMIAKTMGDKPVKAVAFDFSRNQAIVPSWMSRVFFDPKPKSDWLKQDELIEKMIAAHGGLSNPQITDDTIKVREKELWFWQTPP